VALAGKGEGRGRGDAVIAPLAVADVDGRNRALPGRGHVCGPGLTDDGQEKDEKQGENDEPSGWVKQDYYRGSQYPPFSIEPVPYERQRLAGAGMTAEDRALRKQWVKDQELSPGEPRYVKNVTPRNFIRRLYMGPTDSLFLKLMPVIVSIALQGPINKSVELLQRHLL